MIREVISPLAFGVFVAITTIQCHYQGAARVALSVVAGVALWLSMYLFTRIMRDRQK